MRRLVMSSVVGLVLAGMLALPAPTVNAQASPNGVFVSFTTGYRYNTSADTFSNGNVTGNRVWTTNLFNLADTGQPVTAVTLTLDSASLFDQVTPTPVMSGPPTYQWSLGDISENYSTLASVRSDQDLVTYTPGFDATRTANQTTFTASGTQILNVTTTPRQPLSSIRLTIEVAEDAYVNPIIVSPVTDVSQGINLSGDGRRLSIQKSNPDIDIPLTYQVTIDVALKPGVTTVDYMPKVRVGGDETLDSGGVEGASSLSRAMPGVGIWTWNASGSYSWSWQERLAKDVNLMNYTRLPEPNRVFIFFSTSDFYNTSADTFSNGNVTGHRDWNTGIRNIVDSTGQPVTAATLTLDTATRFDYTTPTPTVSGPPYLWSLGNLPEQPLILVNNSVTVGLNQDPIDFTPGFDLARSASQTRFTTSGIQTLNITATARQTLPRLDIRVRVAEDAYVNPTIISPTTTGQVIYLSGNGRELRIRTNNPVVDTPYTYEVTINVVLKSGTVDYMPRVQASWGDHPPTTPAGLTSSFSRAIPGPGTWTWSAQGTYEWNWQEGTNRGVILNAYSRPNVNRVHVYFSTNSSFNVSGDSFTNGEVTGNRSFGSGLQNNVDDSGLPVIGATLALDTPTTYDYARPTPVVSGPPSYQWAFGDIPEQIGNFHKDVSVGFNQDPTTFTPGFDLSRSASQTRFTESVPQTLTVTATPRQALTSLNMSIRVTEDAYVNPVFVSPSDPAQGVYVSDDLREMRIIINNPVIGNPYTYPVTIYVALKPGVTSVDYMPSVNASWPEVVASGTVDGASTFSRAMPGPGGGIWTWNATGSYSWNWSEHPSRSVNLNGYSRSSVNRVHVYFSTNYSFNVSGDSFTNGEITGNRSFGSGLQNNVDDTALPVIGATLALDTPTTYERVNPSVAGPPYNWSFGDIPEQIGTFHKDASVGFNQDPVTYTPGFDLSRSVNQTRFTASGTQTLTVTAIPRQVLPWLNINIKVTEDGYVNPTITSPTTNESQGISMSDNFREVRIRIENPVLGNPYTYQITINVALKPGVTSIDYMPSVSVNWQEAVASGTVDGASTFSRAMPGVGTWTWNTTGSYSWNWSEHPSRSVNLNGYSRLPQGDISGRVVIAGTNTGIGDVQINVQDAATYQGKGSIRTQGDGIYNFSLPAGSYLVQARPSATGLAYVDKYFENVYSRSQARPVSVAVDVTTGDINFSLEPAGFITGTVTAEGLPINNVQVNASAVVGNTYPFVAGARTKTDGSYRLNVPAGTLIVQARPSDTAGLMYANEYYDGVYTNTQAQRITVAAGETRGGINISLEPGGTVSGRVVATATGQPVVGATVNTYLYSNLNPGALISYGGATTDINGNYRISVPVGQYGIRANASGYATEWHQETYLLQQALGVTVAAGGTVSINFSLEPGYSIQGHVYQSDGQTPLAGITIAPSAYDPPIAGLGGTTSGADGSYRIDGLPEGTYIVPAFSSPTSGSSYIRQYYNGKEYWAYADRVTVGSATGSLTGIDFRLSSGAGSIGGRIYEADNVTPITRALIEAYILDNGTWILAHRTPTSDDGNYRLTSMKPGSYRVKATVTGYVPEWYRESATENGATLVTVTALTETPGVDFTLSREYQTPAGNNVSVVDTFNGVTATFSEVTRGGNTFVNVSDQPPATTSGFAFLNEYYDVVTEASYSGNITLTMSYSDADIPPGQLEQDLRLLHWTGSVWEDVTVSLDTLNNKITGMVSSLSWLSVGIPPKVTWLPPLSTETVYTAQDGRTVPIKFQLTDAAGNPVSTAAVFVTVVRDSDGVQVLTGSSVYESDIHGYRFNAQTKDWALGDYTIRLSVNKDARYGMSIVAMGEAKGKQK